MKESEDKMGMKKVYIGEYPVYVCRESIFTRIKFWVEERQMAKIKAKMFL